MCGAWVPERLEWTTRGTVWPGVCSTDPRTAGAGTTLHVSTGLQHAVPALGTVLHMLSTLARPGPVLPVVPVDTGCRVGPMWAELGTTYGTVLELLGEAPCVAQFRQGMHHVQHGTCSSQSGTHNICLCPDCTACGVNSGHSGFCATWACLCDDKVQEQLGWAPCAACILGPARRAGSAYAVPCVGLRGPRGSTRGVNGGALWVGSSSRAACLTALT